MVLFSEGGGKERERERKRERERGREREGERERSESFIAQSTVRLTLLHVFFLLVFF